MLGKDSLPCQHDRNPHKNSPDSGRKRGRKGWYKPQITKYETYKNTASKMTISLQEQTNSEPTTQRAGIEITLPAGQESTA